MKVGSVVHIILGKYKDIYGIIIYIDENIYHVRHILSIKEYSHCGFHYTLRHGTDAFWASEIKEL